jgi:molecular chaperone DnaK
VYSTAADNQSAVDIVILQGERPMAKDNKRIGTFRLDGIKPAPRGQPQVEVTFDIDANGILHVSAVDKGTGKEQKISITGSSGLSKDEVEKLRKEAELHAEEDKKTRDAVESRNQLDQLVFQVEKMVKDGGDKAPADAKSKVDEAIAEAKKALENTGSSSEELRAAHEKLMNTMNEVAQHFQPSGPEGAGAPGGDASGEAPKAKKKDDKVVDADFEVVDEDGNTKK